MVWVCPEMGCTMDVLQNDHLEGEHDTQPWNSGVLYSNPQLIYMGFEPFIISTIIYDNICFGILGLGGIGDSPGK